MRRFLLILSSALAIFGGGAQAVAGEPKNPRPYIPSYSVNVVDVDVECGVGVDACAEPWNASIFLAPRAKPSVISHEIGHIYFFKRFFHMPNGSNIEPLPGTEKVRKHLTWLLGFDPETPWYATDDWYRAIASSDELVLGEKAPPDEYAADAYAACSLGLYVGYHKKVRTKKGKKRMVYRFGNFDAVYGWDPSQKRLTRVCHYIRALGPVS